MNKVEKELHGYINGTERMSGFDSYDSAEGDMSYFDDMDMSSADGDDAFSYAGGGRSAAALSQPYIIQYTNTTTGDLTAVVFGYNDYAVATNYGNPTGITITNLQGGTYARLITQSNNKAFKLGKFRFQSSTAGQLQQTLTLTHFDANGNNQSSPLNLSVVKDAYQFQNDILDVTKIITVDANTQITFPLLAGATLVISMYPVAIISSKAVLNNGTALNTAQAPRLSGKNVAPVIIQTSQDVKGITKG